MQKTILIALLFIISSCTLPWSEDSIPSEHTFNNDYQRHVKAVFDNIDSTLASYETLLEYISPSGYDDSTIRMSGIIPNMGSGELMVHADAIRETHLMSKFGAEFDIKGFISLVDEMVKWDIKGGLIQSLDSYYAHLDGADLSGSGNQYDMLHPSWENFIQKFSPFLGKWIHINVIDLARYSNTDKTDDSMDIIQTLVGVEFDILTGGKKIRKILAVHPPLGLVGSLGQQGDLYSYNVSLDNTGVLTLVENIMLEYSGTGMTILQQETLRDGLNMITLSGILSIHAEKSEYMSFSGVLTMSGEKSPLAIDIAFLPTETRVIFSEESKELFSLKGRTDGNISEYVLSASGENLMKSVLTRNHGTIEGLDVMLTPPSETGIHMSYSFKIKKDFTLRFDQTKEEDSSVLLTPIDVIGTLDGMTLTMLSGSISFEKNKSVQLTYSRERDGSFRGRMQGRELPGDMTIDGHIKDDDILVNATMMGISSTLTHKKNKDNTFEGSLRLPVATMKWSGKSTKEFYDSFLLNLTSPIVSASLDMKTIDGWLSGPLKIVSSQSPIDIPSIDIRAKRNKTNFSLRTDIGMGPISTDKAHFEWDSNIDIRWDKKAKVKIPTEVIPFSDIYTTFSGSNILDFPSNRESPSQGGFSDM